MIRNSLRFLGALYLMAIATDSLLAQRRRLFTDRVAFGRVTYTSAVTVGSNMVDGYVKVKGSNRFVFPVSDNSIFRPFAAAGDGIVGAYFSANPAVGVTSSHKGGNYPPLPSGAPFTPTSKDANIGKVSAQEYWDINGTVATKITLSWHLESAMSSLAPGGNLNKVYIIGWNGSKWVKIPSVVDAVSLWGGASNLNTGSMTTISPIIPNSYLAYTFGADLSANRKFALGADSLVAQAQETEILHPLNGLPGEIETTVYPNPARNKIFIKSYRKVKQVSLWDLNGRQILSVNGAAHSGIDVNNVPDGMYVVNLEDEKGKISSRKIIISK